MLPCPGFAAAGLAGLARAGAAFEAPAFSVGDPLVLQLQQHMSRKRYPITSRYTTSERGQVHTQDPGARFSRPHDQPHTGYSTAGPRQKCKAETTPLWHFPGACTTGPLVASTWLTGPRGRPWCSGRSLVSSWCLPFHNRCCRKWARITPPGQAQGREHLEVCICAPGSDNIRYRKLQTG